MDISPTAIEAAHLIDRLERLHRNGELTDGLNPAQWEALRYLARANKFSRSPAALADYLGSTRGTVSQTLIALEQKGHITRSPCATDRRAIVAELTKAGEAALHNDPIRTLAADLAAGDETRLQDLLEVLQTTLRLAIARNGGRAFGACHNCRHFRRNVGSTKRLQHHCSLLDEPLSQPDSILICMEQEPADA